MKALAPSANGKVLCPICFDFFLRSELLFHCQTGDRCPGESRDFPAPAGPPGKLTEKAECPACQRVTRERLCPKCYSPLPLGSRRKPPMTIGLIGTKHTGKSHFVGVLVNRIRSLAVDSNPWGFVFRFLGDATRDRYRDDFADWIFKHKVIIPETKSATIAAAVRTPVCAELRLMGKLSFWQKLRRWKWTDSDEPLRDVWLNFFDSAGEDLTRASRMTAECRYIYSSEGLILLLDPLQIPRIAARLSRGKRTEPDSQPPDTSPTVELLDILIEVLREQLDLSDSLRKIPVPLALAFSKCDELDPSGSFHRLHQAAGAARAGLWFSRLPKAWQGDLARICVEAGDGASVADWLTELHGQSSLQVVADWASLKPGAFAGRGYAGWLELLAGKVLDLAPPGRSKGPPAVDTRALGKADRQVFAAALFTATTGRLSAAQDLAAACLDYLRRLRDGDIPAGTPVQVFRLLDEQLPFSGPPTDDLSDRDLRELVDLAQAGDHPCGALRIQRVLRELAEGKSKDLGLVSALEPLAAWVARLAPGRAAPLAEAFGRSLSLRTTARAADSAALFGWIGKQLPGKALPLFLAAALRTPAGSAGLLASVFETPITPPAALPRSMLAGRWQRASAAERRALRKQTENCGASPEVKLRMITWQDELPPPPRLLSRILFRLFKRDSSL